MSNWGAVLANLRYFCDLELSPCVREAYPTCCYRHVEMGNSIKWAN